MNGSNLKNFIDSITENEEEMGKRICVASARRQ
jgi:hypothetical protein